MSGLGGPQLFRDISLSVIAAVGIAKIQLTIKKNSLFIVIVKMSLKGYIFCNDNNFI